MKKIIILIPYFGRFPEWFAFYLESCRWNSTINWLFFTDCSLPENPPENVSFIQMTFQEYRQLVSKRLGINFTVESPYKLCDVRPAYGFIHQEHLNGYDYFGFGDIDIIYGNLRAFYTDEVLRCNAISTHYDRVSGHLFLLKNNEQWINAFRKIPNWQEKMSLPNHLTMDEAAFTKVLRGSMRLPHAASALWGVFDSHKRNHLFKERYSTVLSQFLWKDGSYDYPLKWFWHQGKLTIESGEEFMYLHFMNWKSSQYLCPRYGTTAAWESLPLLIDPCLTEPSQGFCISPLGFSSLQSSDLVSKVYQSALS